MRELFHPTVDQLDLPTILNALSDPVRLQILKTLAAQSETTCAGCNHSKTKSALSHHFKILREAGLINVRVEGKQRFLSIRFDDLDRRFPDLMKIILNNIQPVL